MPLRTSDVAKAAGVNVQTLRYYEREGILPAPRRSPAGYRQYGDEAVRIVTFVKRAQELGFTLREAKELLRLRSSGARRAAAARAAATVKLADIDAKLRDLTAMRAALSSLVDACGCATNGAVECPILEALERKAP